MSRKIIGITVGTPLPKPNFEQTDPTKGDYIRGDIVAAIPTDTTLTNSGHVADAKAVGDALNTKQDKITGAASTITNANLSSYRALVSDGSGKVGVSSVTSDELAQLSGVQENVQEQIDQAELMAKLALPGSLKWDGVIGDRWHLIAEESNGAAMAIVHLYDSDLLAAGVTPGNTIYGCASGVEENGIQVLSFATEVQEDGFVVEENGGIIYIPHDNYSLMGLTTFPKRGIYTLCYTLLPSGIDKSLMYVNAISIEGFSFPDQCETEAYFETVDGTKVTYVGDTLTWDGNIDGREVVIISTDTSSLSLIKMSDSAPTKEELKNSNWNSTLLRNGEELSADGLTTDEDNTLLNNMSMLTYDWLGHVVFFAHNDNASVAGHSLKKGIYFLYGDQNNRTTSLTIEGYDFLVKEKVKETVLKTKHLPLDLRHVGSAFDTISTTTNTIEWDGVVGDRLTVQTTVEDGDSTLSITYVHVSDYTPDAALLTEQGFTVGGSENGVIFEQQVAAEEATGIINTYENGSGYEVAEIIIVALENNFTISSDDNSITFPKKGVYFLSGSDFIPISVLSLSSPLLAAPSTKVQLKEEALPSSIFEKTEKPFEVVWDGAPNGKLIASTPDGELYKISNYAPHLSVFTNEGFSVSCIITSGSESNTFNRKYSAAEATACFNVINDATYISNTSECPATFIVTQEPYDWDMGYGIIASLDKGFYAYHGLGASESFRLSSPLMTQPATQIKESALPDSIKKPADWEQDDPTQLDYIANRPFYDEWSSVLFDSYKAIDGMPFGIPFEQQGDGILVTELLLNEINLPVELDFSRVVPGKTYTIAVGDKTYTSKAFELVFQGVNCVAIGNGALFGEETAMYGDPNAEFLWGYMPVMNAVAMIMFNDSRESGEYWLAMVEGDKIGDTITEDDRGTGKIEVISLDDTLIIGNPVQESKSDAIITVDDLQYGFEVVIEDENGNQVTLNQDSPKIEVNTSTSEQTISDTYEGFYINVSRNAVNDSLPYFMAPMIHFIKSGYCFVNDQVSASAQPGVYFLSHDSGEKIRVVSFKINNSTVFAPSTPIKKIEEKYLPDPIVQAGSIVEIGTTNEITWDGVIENRATIQAEMDGVTMYAVHVSDYVPNMDALVGEAIDVAMNFAGNIVNNTGIVVNTEDGVYLLVDPDNANGICALFAERAMSTTFNGEPIIIPKAGVYFLYIEIDATNKIYISSISSPLIAAPIVKVKRSALPDDIGGDSSDIAGDIEFAISNHNNSTNAHSDIRSSLMSHTGNTSNPHNVTAEQISADAKGSAEQALIDAKAYTDSKIVEPVTSFRIIDQVNGYTYTVCMRNGNLATYCATKKITVASMPIKTEYMVGEYFDAEGLIVNAIAYDGTVREIDDLTYQTTPIEYGTTEIEILCVEYGTTYSVTVPIIVKPFDPEVVLIDFDYTSNNNGTYTITGWKGTYNGVASTELIVPENSLIVV